jgi:pimeloyl-ACP methyl ester carboxylesterase
LTSRAGTFRTATIAARTGTVHYPTDAEPPFAAVAVCGGFLNTGPEMAGWGPFYASHGIVTIITTTTGADFPDIRATKLLASITELKGLNSDGSSPLSGKLAGRYGTSGYSMGGGGTTLASRTDATLRTSVGLAAWAPNGASVSVPTLLLCGSSDTVAPCSGSSGAYNQIPNTTPKMMISIAGATHFHWFGPADAGGGQSGEAALAFQKVYLEGDERWKPFQQQVRGTKTSNIN